MSDLTVRTEFPNGLEELRGEGWPRLLAKARKSLESSGPRRPEFLADLYASRRASIQ